MVELLFLESGILREENLKKNLVWACCAQFHQDHDSFFKNQKFQLLTKSIKYKNTFIFQIKKI